MTQWLRSVSLAFALAILAAGPACVRAQSASPPGPVSASGVVARLGDRTITVADLDAKWRELDAASYMRSTQEQYDLRSRVLDLMVGDYLIEQEAKKRGVTADQLLASELPKRVTEVSEADLQTAYMQMRGQMNGASLDQVRPALKAYLERQRQTGAREAFVAELRAKASGIDVSLDPPRYPVPPSTEQPVRGPADAPVEIVEFSDFQCPFCGRATPTLNQIRKTFGDQVKIVFRDFPLTAIHPQAYQAAEAGECARQQGKFWEYHDALFANQRALSEDDLKRHAAEIGLDAAKFAACLDGGQAKAHVDADLKEGEALGVSSTPSFFINGRFVAGALPYATFEQIIKDELARKK